MPRTDPRDWWQTFRNLPDDSPARTFIVALAVAAVAALAVMIAAYALRPVQEISIAAERRQQVEKLLASVPGLSQVLADAHYNRLEARIVDLRLGDFARGIDPSNFDAEAAAADPNLYTFIEEVDDFAGISRRPDLLPIYLAYRNERMVLMVLPVYGAGVQSGIEANIALQGDLNTIYALDIHAQGEPGMSGGGDPAWLLQWKGKKVRDQTGAMRLDVVEGGGAGLYEVGTPAGSAEWGERVADLVRFWLGDHGFGPFLARMRGE